MKSKRLAQILFLLAFLAILFGGLFFFLRKPKEEISYYENRVLAQRPAFSQDALWNGSYCEDWTDFWADHAPGRNTLLRLGTWLDLNLLHRPVVNDVVPVDRSLLAFYPDLPVDRSAVSASSAYMADRFAELNELVTSYGGTFLYVAVPGQTTALADRYPWYLSDHQERDMLDLELFSADLAARGVPFLDVGVWYEQLGNIESFYSEADYHYTYPGAFAAYQTILPRINELSGLELKVYTEDEVELQSLPNPYLGSRLRKAHGLWASTEHPVIGVFQEPVSFRRYERGTPVYPAFYALPENDWQEVSYSLYMNGDCAETTIQTDRPALPDLLVFGDSFTNPLETLLYASFDEMRSLDLRHYKDQSLLDYVQDYQPEVVICVRDYQALLDFNGNGTLS